MPPQLFGCYAALAALAFWGPQTLFCFALFSGLASLPGRGGGWRDEQRIKHFKDRIAVQRVLFSPSLHLRYARRSALGGLSVSRLKYRSEEPPSGSLALLSRLPCVIPHIHLLPFVFLVCFRAIFSCLGLPSPSQRDPGQSEIMS